jgi:hypothetical protein
MLARLVVEISADEPGYAPGRPLDMINCHHVLLALRALRGQELVTRDEPVREEVYGEFARIQAAEQAAASGITLLALVTRAQARLQLAPPVAEAAIVSAAAAPPVTELPNEPVVTAETAPPGAGEITETSVAPGVASPPTDKNIEPIRPFSEPSTDEERNFPL